MKVLYFDCFSGISGDMTIGALLDLGIDQEVFRNELKKLNLGGYELIIEKKSKNGIYGTDFTVVLTGQGAQIHAHEDHGHKQTGHSHDHGREHSHGNGDIDGYNDICNNNNIAGHGHPARNLRDIEKLINESTLKQSIKDFSIKVFREIAKAEAKVHNKNINEVHFHEVGAIDSIIDIVGSAICIDLLGVKKVFSSALHEGRGFIQCQHGILPVPVPAVMEMLVDSRIPLVTEDINTELVTPTGLGIIKSLCGDYGNMPAMIIEKIGYGFGKKDTGRLNALRVVLGTMPDENMMMEEIAVLETNIDDMSPELLGFTMEKLLEQGALDVFHTPVYMKKNRPAVLLTVLCKKGTENMLADIILKETTSLGIRMTTTKRYCMNRETKNVNTRFGNIRVKVASKGDFKKIAPEYEDCRLIAKREGVPIRDVYNSVLEKASELI